MEENEPQPHLSFPVDSNDAASGLMRGGDEDGLTTDAIRVDKRASLNVVQIDVSILGYHECHTMLLAGLRTQSEQNSTWFKVMWRDMHPWT